MLPSFRGLWRLKRHTLQSIQGRRHALRRNTEKSASRTNARAVSGSLFSTSRLVRPGAPFPSERAAPLFALGIQTGGTTESATESMASQGALHAPSMESIVAAITPESAKVFPKIYGAPMSRTSTPSGGVQLKTDAGTLLPSKERKSSVVTCPNPSTRRIRTGVSPSL